MRTKRLALVAALSLAAFFSCVDGKSPLGPDTLHQGTVSFAIVPRYAQAASAAEAAPVSRIRVTALIAGTDSVLTTWVQDVDPTADEWTLEVDVPVPTGGEQVELIIELLSVDEGGAETVEWSGKSPPLSVEGGQSSAIQTVSVVRGPTDNLAVTGVEILGAPDSLSEGDTARVTARITTTDPGAAPTLFWTALDTVVSIDSTGLIRALLPGPARIVAQAGGPADTVTLDIHAVPVGVDVVPDTIIVDSLGAEPVFQGFVVDARGDPIPGLPLTWRSDDTTHLASLGDGRFRVLAASAVRVEALFTPEIRGLGLVIIDLRSTDVALKKAADRSEAFEGDTVTFTVDVSNLGQHPATRLSVVDVMPHGLDLLSASTDVGAYDAAAGLWTVGDMAPGTTATLTLSAETATGTAGRVLLNQAWHQALTGEIDTVSSNDTASAGLTVRRRTSDVRVDKAANLADILPGDSVVYTVTVTNAGPDDAHHVAVADRLPGGLELIAFQTTRGSYDTVTGVWDLGALPAAVQESATVTARAGPQMADSLKTRSVVETTNTASASWPEVDSDPDPSNNSASAVVRVLRPPLDLALSKTVSATDVFEGDSVTYVVELLNSGPGVATGVQVSEEMPGGLTFMRHESSLGSFDPAQGVWSIEAVEEGQRGALTLVARVDSGTVGRALENRAWIGAAEQVDDRPGNDTARASVLVGERRSDLELDKRVDRSTAFEGDTATFTIVVHNRGPFPFGGVEVRDSLAHGLTLVSAAATAGTFDETTATWRVGDVAADAEATLSVRARVDSGTVSDTLRNRVRVAALSAAVDTVALNDTASAGLTVLVKTTDLVITKSTGAAEALVGGTVTFSIGLSNVGDHPARDISVRDVLPGGLTLVSAQPSSGSFDPGSLTWSLGELGARANTEMQLVTRVEPGTASGTLTNSAVITGLSGVQDPNTANNVASASVTVRRPVAHLRIEKTANVDEARPGDTIVYTLQVTNPGPDDATGVQVTDRLPQGLVFVDFRSDRGGYDPTTGVWAPGGLAKGGQVSGTVTALLDPGVDDRVSELANAAILDWGESDVSTVSNQVVVRVVHLALDLSIFKDVSVSDAFEGDTVSFTVEVQNHGPGTATGVQVADALPSGVRYVTDQATRGSFESTTGLWSVDLVPEGESEILTLFVQVDSGTAGRLLENTAWLGAVTQTDDNPTNDTARASFFVDRRSADVAVWKEVNSYSAFEGDTVTFTVVVENWGPFRTRDVAVTDELGAGLTVVSAGTTVGSFDEASGLWSVGDLEVNASDTLRLVARVDSGTVGDTLWNRARVAGGGSTTDPDSTNNEGAASVVVERREADVAVYKEVNNGFPFEGDFVTFTIVAENWGPFRAEGVSVTDRLPPGLSLEASGATTGRFSPTGEWVIGTMEVNASDTLRLVARVDTGTVGDTLINEVQSFGPTNATDPDPTNDIDSASVVVDQRLSDISVWKDVNNAFPFEGDTVTYTVSVDNFGPYAAGDVNVQEMLDSALVPVSVSTTSGTFDTLTGVWSVGAMAVNASDTLVLVARVDSGTVGDTLWNRVLRKSVTGAVDPDATNDSAAAFLVVDQRLADIDVQKDADVTDPSEGDTITYTVIVSNWGPFPATGVTILDTLPTGLTFLAHLTPTSGVVDSVTGAWALDSMAVNQIDTLRIKATVNSGTAGDTIVNVAWTAGGQGQADPDTANNAGKIAVTVTVQQADLAVYKDVSDPAPFADDTITFFVSVDNSGPFPATGVVVHDTLPPGFTVLGSRTTQGAWDAGTGVWTVGSMAVGQIDTLSIDVRVDSVSTTQNRVNVAWTDGPVGQVDPFPADDTSSVTVKIDPARAGVAVRKFVDNSAPFEGDTVAFTVEVENFGPFDATQVQIVDSAQAGLTIVRDSATLGAYDGPTGVWTVDTIFVGGFETLTLWARVDSGTALSTLRNKAGLVSLSGGVDADAKNDTMSALVTVDQKQADVAILKDVNNTNPFEGDTIEFTVAVDNFGGFDAPNVEVWDSVDAGLTVLGMTVTSGTVDSLKGVWTIGPMPAGASDTLKVRVQVDSGTYARTLWNRAVSLGSPGVVDPDYTNDGDSISVFVERREADLDLYKDVNNASPFEGDTVTFTVSVTNWGSFTAHKVKVVDSLAPGYTFVGATPTRGAFDTTTSVWVLDSLAINASDTLRLLARVDSGTFAQTLVNRAWSLPSATEADPDPSNDTTSTSVTVIRKESDLALDKTVNVSQPFEGDTVTWEVSVVNWGSFAATGVSVLDTLPAGLTFISATATQGVYDTANATWDVGNLAVNAADTLRLLTRVDSGTFGDTIRNRAQRGQLVGQADPDPTNDTVSAWINVIRKEADLSVLKDVNNTAPFEGDTVTYTVELQNFGSFPATGVKVRDSLPADLTFVSASATAGAYDTATKLWVVDSMAVNATDSLRILMRVDSGTVGDTIRNTAVAQPLAAQFDPVSSDNADSVELVVNFRDADLSLYKDVDDTAPLVGDTITYLVELTNWGSYPATDIEVADTLPAGLIYLSSSATRGSYDTLTSTWTVDTLPVNKADTLHIVAEVGSSAVGAVTRNLAAVRPLKAQIDTDLTDNADSVDIAAVGVDLKVTKSTSNATPSEFEEFTYTVTVTNVGSLNATGVEINDTLPPGIIYVSDTRTQGTYTVSAGRWVVGNVNAGTSATLTITVKPDTATSGSTFTNRASVRAVSQVDAVPANDTAEVDVTVTGADYLKVAMTVSKDTLIESDSLTYEISVVNPSTASATNVVVTDTMPMGISYGGLRFASQGTYDSGTGDWSVGTVNPGDSLVLRLWGRPDAGITPADPLNIAFVKSLDQADTLPANDTAQVTSNVHGADYLRLTKTASKGAVIENDTLTYEISVVNPTVAPVTGVLVWDTLPPGVTFGGTRFSSTGAYSSTTHQWGIGTVNPGDSLVLRLWARVNPGQAGATLTNRVHVDVDQTDTLLANNAPQVSSSVTGADYLKVGKEASTSTPAEHEDFIYTIAAVNLGTTDIPNAAVYDTLPPGIDYLGVNSSSRGSYNSGTGKWTIGNMNPGDSVYLKLDVEPTAGWKDSVVVNLARVTSDLTDTNPANDAASVAVTVATPTALTVSTSVNKANPPEGDSVVFTVTVTNNGPSTADTVEVTDVVPAGLTYAAFAGPGTYDSVSGLWRFFALPGSTSLSLDILAMVNAGTNGTPLKNVAEITRAVPVDTSTLSQRDSAFVTPVGIDLSVTKVSNKTSVLEGTADSVVYTITVQNNSAVTVTGIQVTDTAPSGMTFTDSIPSQGTFDYSTWVWDVGALSGGSSATLTLLAEFSSLSAGTVVNTATLTAVDQTDIVAANDVDADTLTVTPAAQQQDAPELVWSSSTSGLRTDPGVRVTRPPVPGRAPPRRSRAVVDPPSRE